MDTKRLISVLLLSLAITAGWVWLQSWINRKYPAPPPVATTQRIMPPAATTTASAPAAPEQAAPASLRVAGGTSAQSVQLGDSKYDPKGTSPYSMGLSLGSRGAAIEAATLNRFAETAQGTRPYVFQLPYTNAGSHQALATSMATRSVTINGATADLWDRDWKLVESSASTATFEVEVYPANTDRPVVIRKKYELPKAAPPTEGYELTVAYSFDNRTGVPVTVQITSSGPTVPVIENARDTAEVVAGHPKAKTVEVTHNALSAYPPDKGAQTIDKTAAGMLWVGYATAYFDAIILPESSDGKPAPLAQVTAQAVAPPSEVGHQYVALTLQMDPITIAADQSAALPLHVFLGPRWRQLLDQGYYTAYPRSYDKTLVLTGGICGFCTWPWLINGLVWLLAAFHVVLRDWGLAIILLVLLVRLALHPITKRSQVQMSKMGKMAPEIERLKKKYGDNKEELNRAMMDLYKEQGPAQIMGCLPMFLQMPIWIALWTALQTTFELRHAPFLFGLTWIHDLSQPDHLLKFSPFHVPLLGMVDGLNLLPILMGVVFYMQQKLMPKAPATTPEQEQQQKMMQWMTLIFPLFLYTGPSGLNLYILTSTAIGIWESKRVREHIKQQEEREKAGRVIIDAPATRSTRVHAREKHQEQVEKEPGGCLGQWFVNLQRRAEDLRDQARKQQGKRKK